MADLTDEQIFEKVADYFYENKEFGDALELTSAARDAVMERNMRQNFMISKCDVFTDDEEMKLEYTPIYQEYQDLFDKLISGHLESISVPAERFHEMCKQVMASNDELAEEKKAMLNMMVMVSDYDCFLMEMRRCAEEKREGSS